MSTRRAVRQAHKTGAYAFAQVEESRLGFATIRLGSNGSGARLSNLPVIGSAVSVGDIVIVDYASGSPPKVRPVTQVYTETPTALELAQLPAPTTIEDTRDPSGNYVLYIYNSTSQAIGAIQTTINFDTEKFDTGALYDPAHSDYITITDPGYYFFIAHICVAGLPSKPSVSYESYGLEATDASINAIGAMNNNWVKAYLKSTGGAGIFGFGIAYATGHGNTTVEVMGFGVFAEGDKVSVLAQGSVAGLSSVVGSNGLSPRLMGHRMSRDGRWENAGGTGIDDGGGTQAPPEIDDTDIVIMGNRGYLHVSDTPGAYARAMAQASDWTDEEVTFTITFADITASADFRVWLRTSRDWFATDRPTNGYELSISNTGGWSIFVVNLGVRTLLGSYNAGASLLPHYVKFYAKGSDIKAKLWPVGSSEPTWQIQVTNGDVANPGDLQLGFYRNSGEHMVYIDDIDLHGV